MNGRYTLFPVYIFNGTSFHSYGVKSFRPMSLCMPVW